MFCLRVAVLTATFLSVLSVPAGARVFFSDLDGLEVAAEEYLWLLGDDPSFADPSSADLETFPDDWTGIGWLRFNLRLDPALEGRPIGLRVIQEGATEVFIDGAKVHAFGVPGIDRSGEQANRAQDPRPVVFSSSEDGRHVLAVRYSAWLLETRRWSGVDPLVEVHLGELRPMAEERLRQVRLLTFHQMFLTGLFLAFALVHLMLFLFRPVDGPNLFCGLSAASAAATIFFNFGAYVQPMPEDFVNWHTLFQIAFVALALTSLRFVYDCSTATRPAHFPFIVGAGLNLAVWSVFQPFRSESIALIFMLIVNVEMIRATLEDRDQRLEGMWVLGLGGLPLAVLSPYQLLAGLGIVPSYWDFLTFPSPYYGLAAIMFAMTIFLGLDFSRREFERTRLEVENARRAKELEETRRLQVSMLPSSLPESESLEIAVHAETATEVGGDYYDFFPSESSEGELNVIVGDASGSGAQAGSLVAATKGMLLTYADPSPAACLNRLSRGLRRMGLRRRHMALVAVHFAASGRRLTLAAAAMPPVLIYRAGAAEVEAVEIQSLPLGSFREPDYRETTLDLEPGDRVVLMSDGLPETVDAEIEPLGYERIESLVAEHGAASPAELITALVEAGRDHCQDERADDDVTLMVVGVRNGPGSKKG